MNEPARWRRGLITLALLLACAGMITLSGCGGGGGGGGNDEEEATGQSLWGEMQWGEDDWE